MNKSICFITGALGNAGGQERALTNLTNEFAVRKFISDTLGEDLFW